MLPGSSSKSKKEMRNSVRNYIILMCPATILKWEATFRNNKLYNLKKLFVNIKFLTTEEQESLQKVVEVKI